MKNLSVKEIPTQELLTAINQDQKLAELVANHLGRPADPTGNNQAVLNLQSSYGFRLEWHPKSRKLYLVPDEPEPGEKVVQAHLVAENVDNHGMALNMANVFGRGYNMGVFMQQQGRAKNNGVPVIKKD
jgi:hypothetical protein